MFNLKTIVSFLYKQKTKDFFVYGIGQMVNILTPLLITPYLIFVCGIENLGIIATGQAFAYILIVVVDYSSYIIGVKNVSINKENQSILQNIFITNYVAKFFLLVLVCFLTFLMVYFIPYFNKNTIVYFYSMSIIIAQFINPVWFFQGVENFLLITIINIIAKTINVFGVFLFINNIEDYIYANLWIGIGAIIANLIGFLFLIKKYKFSFKVISLLSVRNLLKDDFLFCVSQIFYSIRNYSSVMIIGFFAGNYVAGQFKVVEQIINFFRTYLQIFFKFSYSHICSEIEKNSIKGFKLWKKYNLLNSIFLIVLLSSVFLLSEIILTFFKVDIKTIPEFKNYLHIALLIPLLIGVTMPLEQLLFSLNKNNIYIKTTIIITLINIIGLSFTMILFQLREAFFLLIITELILMFIYLSVLKLELLFYKNLDNKNSP